MAYLFDPPPQPALPVAGETFLFPVHRIYCVGRNYAEHAREMGSNPDKDPPIFFQKNPDNLVRDGVFPYPSASEDVHWEIEMVVALHSGGVDIAIETALDHVYGYAAALDMTRRDLQNAAKNKGQPWEVSKAFEKSAPCSALVPATEIGYLERGAIWLEVNGTRRQESDLAEMIWTIPQQIAYLSRLFELRAGDLIFTGTPSGVGAVRRGDVLKGHVDGLPELTVKVV